MFKTVSALKMITVTSAISLLLAGCFNQSNSTRQDQSTMDHSNMNHSAMNASNSNNNTSIGSTTQTAVADGKDVTLTAKASNLELYPGKTVPVWTFNNSVPGPEIRIKQGETLKVTLKNELPEPVSIHFHGYPAPNAMDGIPGVTQNAVQPGGTFTYEFKATVPGTYWYHSHQDSVNQLDRGLYGSFVVEGSEEKTDRDVVLMLDEWMSSGMANGMNMSNMNNMSNMADMGHGSNHGTSSGGNGSNSQGAPVQGHNMSMYDIFTINGKSGASIVPLNVKQGEKVRFRLINAGYLSHQIHFHGQNFKVTASDGQPINQPAAVKDQLLSIAPGERYDVEFTADQPGTWLIEDHSAGEAAKGMKLALQVQGSGASPTDQPNEKVALPILDLTKYGASNNTKFSLNQSYDVSYTMELNTKQEGNNQWFTINGKTFPDTENIQVKKGDKVKVTLVNNSPDADHPMHLHGHFFQVLSKNGKPLEGSQIVKDTLNVKPGEQYVVAFEADNPGEWMFHCHDLHHASAGMVTELKYTDYKNAFTPDSKAGNKPE